MLFYREKILSPGQLKRLSEHKYSCDSASICDKLLQPWWNWLVGRVPIWLAPNLITILGLLVNIITTLILMWYSPDAITEAPRWTFILCALGLFVYQSLDAIDGKQARRTGTSSPLGELFDHGCDSISTVFVAVSACIAVRLGSYPSWMFFQCFCAVTLFYCAHWQTYVSGTLRFGKVDVTEAQFTIMGIHLISAFLGPSIWETKVFPSVESVELWHLMFLSTVICASVALYHIFFIIFTGGIGKNGSTVAISGLSSQVNQAMSLVFFVAFGKMFFTFSHIFWTGGAGKNGSTVALPWVETELKTTQFILAILIELYMFLVNAVIVLGGGVGKNGSSVAGTSVLSPVIPLSLVVIPAYIIYRKSPQHVFEQHPVLYIIAFGLVAAKVTNKLVVAHMTKNEMEYFDSSLFGPLMLFLNQYFSVFIPEYFVLYLCLIWVCFDLVRYCRQVCLEICDHMRIELFRIVPNMTQSYPVTASQPFSKNGTASSANSRQTRSQRKQSRK